MDNLSWQYDEEINAMHQQMLAQHYMQLVGKDQCNPLVFNTATSGTIHTGYSPFDATPPPYDAAGVVTPYDAAGVLTPYDAAGVLTPYDAACVLTPYDAAGVLTPYDAAGVVTPYGTELRYGDSMEDTGPREPEDFEEASKLKSWSKKKKVQKKAVEEKKRGSGAVKSRVKNNPSKETCSKKAGSTTGASKRSSAAGSTTGASKRSSAAGSTTGASKRSSAAGSTTTGSTDPEVVVASCAERSSSSSSSPSFCSSSTGVVGSSEKCRSCCAQSSSSSGRAPAVLHPSNLSSSGVGGGILQLKGSDPVVVMMDPVMEEEERELFRACILARIRLAGKKDSVLGFCEWTKKIIEDRRRADRHRAVKIHTRPMRMNLWQKRMRCI